MAHFEAMFGARIGCFSAKVLQSYSSDLFSLQPKQLQPDYVSSYNTNSKGRTQQIIPGVITLAPIYSNHIMFAHDLRHSQIEYFKEFYRFY